MINTVSNSDDTNAEKIAIQNETLRIELSTLAYIQRQREGQHPNLIRLIGTTTIAEDNQFCLLTEYCEYGSLDCYLQKKYDNNQFVNETVVCSDRDHESSDANQIATVIRFFVWNIGQKYHYTDLSRI